MRIDPVAPRAYLDSMHVEADARDRHSDNIRKILKSAKEGHQLDGKTVRKIFVRERMEPEKRQREDDLLEAYQDGLGAKGAALRAIEAGATVEEAAKANGVHRATLARARHVAKHPSNATPAHDPDTGEVQTNNARLEMPVAEESTDDRQAEPDASEAPRDAGGEGSGGEAAELLDSNGTRRGEAGPPCNAQGGTEREESAGRGEAENADAVRLAAVVDTLDLPPLLDRRLRA